jgi:hypothetical protein
VHATRRGAALRSNPHQSGGPRYAREVLGVDGKLTASFVGPCRLAMTHLKFPGLHLSNHRFENAQSCASSFAGQPQPNAADFEKRSQQVVCLQQIHKAWLLIFTRFGTSPNTCWTKPLAGSRSPPAETTNRMPRARASNPSFWTSPLSRQPKQVLRRKHFRPYFCRFLGPGRIIASCVAQTRTQVLQQRLIASPG